MNTTTHPTSYRPAQIVLHWIVVVGILLQFGFNDKVVQMNEAQWSGVVPAPDDATQAWMHVSVGFLILLSVLARLWLRFKYGAPGHAPGTPALQARIATAVHWALYGLLVLMALTGMATWNGLANLGDAHFLLATALFFLIIAHAVAALFNQFVRKDGTLRRMMPARKSGA